MKKLCLALLLLASCTDSTDISLFVPFALFASDELSSSSTGICGFTAITQAAGFYKGSGLLELDPAINPNAEYTLGLQVENYLDETVITDSNGVTISGVQRNDMTVRYANVHYDDVGGNLTSVSDVTVYVSGTVRVGGEQNAGVVVIQPAVGPVVVGSWVQSFENSNLLSEQVIVSVQIFRRLDIRRTGPDRDFPLPAHAVLGLRRDNPLSGARYRWRLSQSANGGPAGPRSLLRPAGLHRCLRELRREQRTLLRRQNWRGPGQLHRHGRQPAHLQRQREHNDGRALPLSQSGSSGLRQAHYIAGSHGKRCHPAVRLDAAAGAPVGRFLDTPAGPT